MRIRSNDKFVSRPFFKTLLQEEGLSVCVAVDKNNEIVN